MPLTQHSSIPKSIFPIFQHSNIPIGAKPLTCHSKHLTNQLIKLNQPNKLNKLYQPFLLSALSYQLALIVPPCTKQPAPIESTLSTNFELSALSY
jgi:hypothetical protein